MIVRLKELLPGPRHFDLRFESGWWEVVNPEPDGQVLGLDGPLKVRLALSREGRYYAADGSLSGSVRARCDRCLEVYSHHVRSRFRLLLASPLPEPVAGDSALLEEDMSVEFLSDEEVNIDQLVREQLYLALPVKFLCHEGCRGLCSGCGANLNYETCTCPVPGGHPAFRKLEQLKVKMG
ncbi:MAG: DUF177 domain-containing protein [Deltaproteobacteria bacterium]|nr:DUF177 domain-containing protein [Deltaproteobacteria bacterium]